MGTITQTITTNQLVVGDGVRTENAKVKTATAYKRGDLLNVDANNVADHPVVTEGVVGEWNAIAVSDFNAEQSTYHAANNLEMPIYVQGPFDIEVRIDLACRRLQRSGREEVCGSCFQSATRLRK